MRACWCLALAVAAAGAEPVDVVGGPFTLSFDGETGDVLSLRDEAGDLLATDRASIFRVQTRASDGAEAWLSGGAARAVTVARDGDALTLRFAGVAAGLEVEVVVSGDGEALRPRIRVLNTGDLAVERVCFPDLRFRRGLSGDPAADEAFLPGGDGCLIRAEGLRDGRSSWREYPGSASMQFVAYWSGDRGVQLTCQDPEPGARTLAYVAEADHLRFELWARLPRVPGAGFEGPPWEVAPCTGWQRAAARYREWALRQPWAAPKTGAAAPPEWLRRRPLVLTAQFRPLGNGRWFVPLERVREFARVWRDDLGATDVMIEWRDFERGGVYTSPDFFPLHPSPEIVAETLRGARADGVRSQAMVAALKWMIEREAYHTPHYNVTGYDGRELFEREGPAACAIGSDGEITVREPFFTWDGRHAFLCPASDFARRHLVESARVLAAAGFPLFEFDQCNGGGVAACYSTEHGHPPGAGPWQHEALAARMAEVRAAGQAVDPDFATGLEDPSERLIPWLDCYVSRAGNLTDWPAAGEGTEVVPAFAFVYHDRVQPMTIDLQHTVRPADELVVRSARAFLGGGGVQTQLTPWQVLADYGEDDLFPTPAKMDARQRTMLRALMRTQHGPAREILRDGRLLEDLDLAVPTYTFEEHRYTPEGLQTIPRTCPAVLHRGWRLADGREVWCFVNVTDEVVELTWPAALGRLRRIWLNGQETERGSRLTVPALSVVTVGG